MKRVAVLVQQCVLVLVCLLAPSFAWSQASVIMQHNDVSRTGQNLNETTLNTSNVGVSTFGKLFWRTVDGHIYAQPLYVSGLNIQGKIRNVVYVATNHNSVYAFDADDPAATTPLWQVSLGTPVPANDICAFYPIGGCPFQDIHTEIGILSTPTIDTPVAGGTMYVVAKTKNTANNTFHFFLHALDIVTGAEKFGGPVEILGSVAGSGTGSSGGRIAFDPLYHLNRPGLLLLNGVVYIAFGSIGDNNIWHGWLFGYNATTLAQTSIYNDTAVASGANGGAIWHSAQGPATDGTYIYVVTGNGTYDSSGDYGDSVLKLNPGGNPVVVDSFTPSNQSSLDTQDLDLGAGGPLLLPGTNLMAVMGKDWLMRLIDTTNMGKFHSNSNNDVQEFQVFTEFPYPFLGTPIYWNSPNFGPVIYLWGPGDVLKAYRFTGTFQTTPVSQGSVVDAVGYANSVPLSLSANGSQAGTGIVWALGPVTGDASPDTTVAALRAFDATNLSNQLWNSLQNPARDDVVTFSKFNAPTIANGKVYVPNFSGQLLVYGLNPPAASGIRFVQIATATPQSSPTSVPVSFTSAQAAGNLNVVVVGWNDATATVQSVTDTLGNTYTLAAPLTRGTGLSQAIYYAKNIAGGANTVTVTFNQGATHPDIRIVEYSGLDPANPFDVTASSSGNDDFSNTGPVTTTAANELIFAANTVNTAVVTEGAPFTKRIVTSPNSDIVQDRIVNVTGSYGTSSLLNAPGPWVMQLVTFKSLAGSTAPSIASVTPSSGTNAGGSPVTLTGTNYVAGATVTFGGTAATGVTVLNATTITATTPAHAVGAVNVVVTNPDTQTGTLTNGFTFVSPTAPTITNVSPASGPITGGTAVTLTGTNYVAGATVTFGGTAATGVTVVNSTTITATTPAHAAGAVNVVVTNPDTQTGTLTNGFTYNPPPSVTSVSPSSGLTTGGTAVTITGSGFVVGATVSFGGTAATSVTVVSASTITATTPAHAAGAVNLVVTNVDTQTGTLANGYTYSTSAAISFVQVGAATPQSATQTVSVVYPLSETRGNLNIVVVGWNDTTATVQSVTDTAGNTYTLAVGPTSGTALRQSIYYAKGIVGGTTTVTVTFSQAAAFPDIIVLEYAGVGNLDKAGGASGSSASASSGSVTTTSANELIFGAAMVFTFVSGAGTNFTSRIITTPDGDIAEDRIVTATGSYSATASLRSSGPWVMQVATFTAQTTNPAPTVTSVTPSNGRAAGGTAVTITGTNFLNGAAVTFGGTAATGVTVVSATSITATTPAHAAGVVNVVVTNTDSQSGTLANGYTYNPAPSISSVVPNVGPATGGTAITINGANFVAGATVTFGGTAATGVSVVSAATITATTPAHAAGAVNVVVTNPDTQTGTLTNGFTYNPPPTLTSVAPNSGTTLGGTAVTLTGTNFVAGATVSFGGTAAAGVTVVSATSITATTPAHAAGAVNVVVTNPDTQTGTLTNGFTYVSATAPTVTNVSPAGGPITGGTAVTLTGTNFVAGATVSFGGTAAAGVTVVSATSITATTPAHAAGAVNVVVTNPDTQTGTLTNGFTYNPPPTVGSVSPNSGSTAGGTAVTITGTNFVAGATVTFGGTAATGVTVVSATSITATTPAHAAGAVNVVVTNPDTQTGTLTNGFTYSTTTAIRFVQVAAATPQSATQTVTVTYPSAQTAGDLNIIVVGWNDATSTVQSVADSRNNTYTLAIGPTTGTGIRQSIYYAPAIAGGTTSVTVTFNQAASFPDIRILEYAGVTTLDKTAGSSGNSSSASSGAATTTTASEVIFGAATVSTWISGAGTSFTSRIITTPDLDNAEDRIVSATGSYSATAPLGSSGLWVMQMATFK